jgi:hypothetical protein
LLFIIFWGFGGDLCSNLGIEGYFEQKNFKKLEKRNDF